MKIILLLLLSMATMNGYGQPTEESRIPTINVLLTQYSPSALIEVKGHFRLFNPATYALVATDWTNRREIVRPSSKGLIFGDLFPGVHKIQILPTDRNGTILINGIQYNGIIEVEESFGALQIVNIVDTENYIRSILTTHFPSRQERSLAQTLAIVARTEAYYLIAHQGNVPWHVKAEAVGYNGCSTFLHNPIIDQSVVKTRGQILTRLGRPFATSWNRSEGNGIRLTAAATMAHQGDSPVKILKNFYPEAELKECR